jgi:hypothetical protein
MQNTGKAEFLKNSFFFQAFVKDYVWDYRDKAVRASVKTPFRHSRDVNESEESRYFYLKQRSLLAWKFCMNHLFVT